MQCARWGEHPVLASRMPLGARFFPVPGARPDDAADLKYPHLSAMRVCAFGLVRAEGLVCPPPHARHGEGRARGGPGSLGVCICRNQISRLPPYPPAAWPGLCKHQLPAQARSHWADDGDIRGILKARPRLDLAGALTPLLLHHHCCASALTYPLLATARRSRALNRVVSCASAEAASANQPSQHSYCSWRRGLI